MRTVRLYLLLAIGTSMGCSLVVTAGGLPADPPSAPSLELSSEAPSRGELVTVTASGSVDPGATPVRYQFEWIREGSIIQFSEPASEIDRDTLTAELNRGEDWTVRVTPISEDGRDGASTEAAFTVVNSLPTVETAALSTYHPVIDDVMYVKSVGYDDADGDAERTIYRWIAKTASSSRVLAESATLDLASVVPLVDAATEELIVEVVPFDGVDQNVDAAVQLGPMQLLEDVTRWRQLSPGTTLGTIWGNELIQWDARHRRFLILMPETLNGIELWEYTQEFGFARLNPAGVPDLPDLKFSAHDSTPGAERLLVFGFAALGGDFKLTTLELHSRGDERWVDVPVEPGPSPPLGLAAGTFYDSDDKVLFMYGGSWPFVDPVPNDDLWLVDLNDPESARFVNGSPFSTIVPITGATLVAHPTEDDRLLIFGGTDHLDDSAFIQSLQYDLSDLDSPQIDIDHTAKSLLLQQAGVFAFSDPERQRVVGGLGVRFVGAPGTVDRVWQYDPVVPSLDVPVAQSFDVPGGAAFGQGGWDGDRVLFWPGAFVNYAMYFHLAEVRASEDGTGYEWSPVVRPAYETPLVITQAAMDGDQAVVTAGITAFADASVAFQYDLTRGTWQKSVEIGPGRRTNVGGGQILAGGVWTVGGSGAGASMAPWRFENGTWEQVETTVPLPASRHSHTVFDTGCGSQAPVGVFGGRPQGAGPFFDETWILACPDSGACSWEQRLGANPGRRIFATAAYDGDRVVLFGGTNGTTLWDGVFVLDVCDSELGWAAADVIDDPVHGRPLLQGHNMQWIPQSEPPEFLVTLGQTRAGPAEPLVDNAQVWRLRQTGEGEYTWSRLETPAPPSVGTTARAAWDDAQHRLLVFDAAAAVWEFRLRD